MKKLVTGVILLFCCHFLYGQNEQKWYTDVKQAYDVSKKTGKPVFAFFTGSDWCGWCHKLQRDVFSKPAFAKWADSSVVLLELDFPRKKQLPTELMQQNRSLQEFFGVTGFPTIWIFNMDMGTDSKYVITPLGSLGYPEGTETGKEELKFLDNAKLILSRRKAK